MFEVISDQLSFGGRQLVVKHQSSSTGTPMRLGIFLPPQAATGKVPVVWFLSGLTCTEENFITKAGAQRVAAELGLMLVVPDTSPRGDDVPNAPEYDLGQGAGFYLNATQAPWKQHFQMETYLTEELPTLLAAHYPADMSRQSITGHSMGGHGALTLALRHPQLYKAVSAFAPISAPIQSPWGEKVLTAYLGDDRSTWRGHDACALIEDGARVPEILVDQGAADSFLQSQLKPELLEAACAKAGIKLTLNLRQGYDHSYYFISSFIEDHLRWHAKRLGA